MTTAREIAARYPGYHYGSGKELEAQIEAYAEEKCRVAREENERLRAMATTELYEAKECNIALSRENAELKAALVEAAIPLEVLYGDDKRKPIREIGTELRVAIEQGVEAVRAALNRPAAVMGEGRGEGVSVECPRCKGKGSTPPLLGRCILCNGRLVVRDDVSTYYQNHGMIGIALEIPDWEEPTNE